MRRKFQSVITELDKEGLKAIAADIGGRDRKKELLETPLWDFIVDRTAGMAEAKLSPTWET